MSTRWLVLGFAGSLLLAFLTLGVSALKMTGLEHETLDVADEAQQSTYYLGDVGEQLARLRFHAALGLGDTPERFARRRVIIAKADALLQRALEALPGALSQSALERWQLLRPEIVRLRHVYEQAVAAIRAREIGRASEMLLREGAATARVHDELDALQQIHREAVLSELRAAHRATSRAGLLEFSLTLGFVSGMLAIWIALIRVLRRQDRRLREYTTRLEAANEDLDAFAGRIAHDLKSAIGGIVMGAPLLRTTAHNAAAVEEFAARLECSSLRSISLIDALLAFSRSQDVEPSESASLDVAIRSVLQELEPRITQLRVDVTVDPIPDLRVRCSQGLLLTLFSNLCENAVKFLDGQPRRRVHIAAQVDDGMCRVDIEDTGPGIPEHAREKIFEPFYRAANTKVSGTGIGLATVRRIVTARGGRIVAEPVETGGTRFRVWLPIAKVEYAAAATASADRPTVSNVDERPSSSRPVGGAPRELGLSSPRGEGGGATDGPGAARTRQDRQDFRN